MYPAGVKTEPRNYAPRTVGRLTDEPPPSFDLSLIKYLDKTNETQEALSPKKEQDPFSTVLPSRRASDELQTLRSDALNKLTNTPTGLPDYTTALSPDIFPFVDAARQAQPTYHGVIKLGNVCMAPKFYHNY